MKYKGKTGTWTISFDPPPIPASCGCDWQFAHEDYDGAPNEPGGPPADSRCGTGPSLEDCVEQIKEMEEDPDVDDYFGEDVKDYPGHKPKLDTDSRDFTVALLNTKWRRAIKEGSFRTAKLMRFLRERL